MYSSCRYHFRNTWDRPNASPLVTCLPSSDPQAWPMPMIATTLALARYLVSFWPGTRCSSRASRLWLASPGVCKQPKGRGETAGTDSREVVQADHGTLHRFKYRYERLTGQVAVVVRDAPHWACERIKRNDNENRHGRNDRSKYRDMTTARFKKRQLYLVWSVKSPRCWCLSIHPDTTYRSAKLVFDRHATARPSWLLSSSGSGPCSAPLE